MYYSTTDRPQPHRLIYSHDPVNLAHIQDRASQREFRIRVGFSGVGSVGVLCRKGEKKSEFVPSIERRGVPVKVEYQVTNLDGSYSYETLNIEDDSSNSYLVKTFDGSQKQGTLSESRFQPTLESSITHEQESSGRRRIASGLTSHGKKLIRDAVSLLTYKYGVRSLGFYTLTCPFTRTEDIQLFNNNYSEICRRYFEEIKREYQRRGCCFSYIGVHEIQPGRYFKTGDQCLHLHYIAPCLDSNRRFILLHSEHVSVFSRIIKRVMGYSSNIPPRIDTSLCKSNPNRYIAKYYSKGNSFLCERLSTGAKVTLSSWYSISRNLLIAVNSTTVELPGHYADELFRASVEGTNLSYCIWVRPIYKNIDGFDFHCGCVFELSKDFAETLRQIKFPEVEHLI